MIGPARRVTRRLEGLPLVSLSIIGGVVLLAVLAPLIAPYSPVAASLPDKLKPPFWQDGGSTQYLLGTDRLGRDILSRIIFGSRVALSVSIAGILVGGLIGSVLGVLAGYFGRWVDGIIMSIADLSLALPIILLALVLAIVLGPSLLNVIIIISALIWARYARQVRGEVLSLKERDFVHLARIAGCSDTRIVLLHVLPNVANSLIVLATLQVGWLILMEGSLSFLGVGVPPPDPSWGAMVADGRELIASAWWIAALPGLAMLLTVTAMNMLGDWLRDALDPKLRQSERAAAASDRGTQQTPQVKSRAKDGKETALVTTVER